MTKKNIRPQQVAPVQRETPANSSIGEKGLQPQGTMGTAFQVGGMHPFAGDDAE